MDNFPTELLQEIFIKLSCKNVAISKSVCKSWHKILSNPEFTANYATNSPFTNVIVEHVNHHGTSSVALLQFSPNGEIIPTPIDNRVPRVGREFLQSTVHLVGTANGLLFLLRRTSFCDDHTIIERLYFSNPFFDECVEVAESKLASGEWDCEYEYKIGYIPKINKYKIMRISYGDDLKVSEANILTVGVDRESRIVEDPFDSLYLGSNGVSLMGRYHWIPVMNEYGADWNICTFDFLDEKCSGDIIPKPIELTQVPYEKMDLRVLNDRLSLIDSLNPSQIITVWTMKKYGVADSWYKQVISCHSIRDTTTYHRLVTVLPDGNIVLFLEGSNTFFYINNEKRESKEVRVPYIDRRGDGSLTYTSTFAPRFHPFKDDINGWEHPPKKNVLSSILGFVFDLFQ